MKKTLVIVGLVIGIFGIVFSLLPHDVHNAVLGGISGEEDHHGRSHGTHGTHITIGVLAAVVGFGLAFAGWKIFD